MANEPLQPRRIFPLSVLTRRVAELLLPATEKQCWVQAQFVADKSTSTGHVYGNLIEVDANGKQVAKIRVTIWSSDVTRIERKFRDAGIPDALRESREICALCSVRYHHVHGLSLSIFDVDPTFGESHIDRKRRKILEQLKINGLLETNKAIALTAAPLRIGLITAEGSAALADFVQTLTTSPFGFSILLATATMQGPTTARTVLEAITRLTNLSVDLICIVRGGGSPMDLAWLDDESISQAVALCPIPVWVGIGHEIDRGVLDVIAHQSHKTPTEVAKVLVDRLLTLAARLESARERLQDVCDRQTALAARNLAQLTNGLLQGTRKHSEIHAERFRGRVSRLQERARSILDQTTLRLTHCRAELVDSTAAQLQDAIETIERNRTGLVQGVWKLQTLQTERHRRRLEMLSGAVDRIVASRAGKLNTTAAKIGESVRSTIDRAAVRIARSQLRIESTAAAQAATAGRELEWRVKQLGTVPRLLARHEQVLAEKALRRDALDPERLLDRGYSVTRDESGKLITSIRDARPGQTIRTQLRDGTLTSTVENVGEGRADD